MVRGIDVHAWAMDQLFEQGGEAHARRPLSFSPHGGPRIPALKEPRGRRRVKPLHASPAPLDVDLTELITGAALLGFVPSPQQERFGRIANASDPDEPGLPLYSEIAETMPRRSGKTEGLLALAAGRCVTRSDYYVAFSAQSGKKGRDRFLKMAVALDRWDPCPRSSRSNPDGCPRDHVHRRIYRSNGGERIEWENGSVFMVLPPDPEAYRGEEYHLIILDEGQETSDQETADELLGGIAPTMDTVPEAQLIIAGTAGKHRTGLLWSALVKGRAGEWGILEYAAPDQAAPVVIDPSNPDEVKLNEQTVLDAHPGIGTLTDLRTINKRFKNLSLMDFQREYLGQWPADPTATAIDLEAWGSGLRPTTPRPKRVALAFDVAPDDSCSALACAWRDDQGVAHVEVLAFRAGVSWLAAETYRVARLANGAVAYDNIGRNLAPATTLVNKRPTPRLVPMGLRDVQGAAQLMTSAVVDKRLAHFGQKDLNLAVEGAAWRPVGENGRAFGHKASAHPIVPLTACALALWLYDKQPSRRTRMATNAA